MSGVHIYAGAEAQFWVHARPPPGGRLDPCKCIFNAASVFRKVVVFAAFSEVAGNILDAKAKATTYSNRCWG